MENQEKNREDQMIDEQYLMSIMAGETQKSPAAEGSKPGQKQTEKNAEEKNFKQKNKSKKVLPDSYGNLFLNAHTMTKRGDKSIYIRPEYHERLSRIIQVIAEDQIPLYAYLDNILAHHFDMFEKEITDDFNNKYRPIF